MMAPFYEADVLFRIMDKRAERVKMAHCFYLEYLRLLDHYGVLEKHQRKVWNTRTEKIGLAVVSTLQTRIPSLKLTGKNSGGYSF